MTVAALPAVVEYIEDGVSKAFPAPFRFKAPTDLVVERVRFDGTVATLAIGTDYTVTGGDTDAGGTVTRTVVTTGARLRIRRLTARAQKMRYPTGGRFPAESHEAALDSQMLISQEIDATLDDTITRALLVPAGEASLDLPIAATRAGAALVFDENGQPVAKPVGSFPPGPSGPANSTYPTLTAFKAAATTNVSANYNGSLWFFTSGDFTGKANDATIVKADSTPLTAGAWVRQYEALDPIWFGAVGNNPNKDTAALQAALNLGGKIDLGAHDATPLVINTTVIVSQPGTVLTGQRPIQTTADVTRMEAIKLTGDDSVVDGINLSNPSLINEQAGYQTWGIAIAAHRCKVTNCSVLDFQMCFGVLPTGEFYDNKFIANYGRVLGGGNGPKNTTSPEGENRGDGIADFGARTAIIGNTLQAANALYGNNGNGPRIPGTDYNDCRIGIDVEGLPGYEADGTGPDVGSSTIISDNHVIPSKDGKGRFRRCYSVEGIPRTIMTGNYGRGYTWNGVWLVGASSYSVVANNVMVCDTDPADQSGAAWQPTKVGFLVYGEQGFIVQQGTTLANNISLHRTALGNGFQVRAVSGATIAHMRLSGNKAFAEVSMGGFNAFDVSGTGAGISLNDNDAIGLWANGFNVSGCQGVDILGGTARGMSANGIFMGSLTGTSTVTDTRIDQAANGIALSQVSGAVIDGVKMSSVGGTELTLVGAGTTHVMNTQVIDGGGSLFDFAQGTIATWQGNVGWAAFRGSAAYVPTAIAAGREAFADLAVTGAKLGDNARVGYSNDASGALIAANVSNGSVRVHFANLTAASLTPVAGTITVNVERAA